MKKHKLIKKHFLEHVRQMTNVMEEQGNPLMEDTKDLIVFDTIEIMGLKYHSHISNCRLLVGNNLRNLQEKCTM